MPVQSDKGYGDPLGDWCRYERVADINCGGYGFVQRCRDKCTGEEVAIKFVKRKAVERDSKYLKYLNREIVNHSVLLHPFVVRFKNFFLLPKYLAIVMELADKGDLFDFVMRRRGLQEPVARRFFQQFVIGLEYCHSNGIVNRDIKPENVLLQTVKGELVVKICDFGNSKNQERGSKARTRVGSPQYMAPEVISSPEYYDGKVADMWSCGVMLYVMLMGRYPFLEPDEKINHSKIFRRMIDGAFPLDESLSEDARDLILSLLKVEPEERLRLAEVKQHPWFLEDLAQAGSEPPTDSAAKSEVPNPEEVERIIQEGVVDPPLDPSLTQEEAAGMRARLAEEVRVSLDEIRPHLPKAPADAAGNGGAKGCCAIS